MKKDTSNSLTPEQRAELDALAALPDEQIDMSDAPEVRNWSGTQLGLFYRPVKQQITLRLDADIIAWFKSKGQDSRGEGYQTSMNRVLREYVAHHTSKE